MFLVRIGAPVFAAAAALCAAAAVPGQAAKPFRGPVEAKVVEVLDGDTFVADVLVWPGHTVRVGIRIRGIDAPEMKSSCAAEKDAARRARVALLWLLQGGTVSVSNVAGGKYYGRVLADVTTENGGRVAESLLAARLVRSYGGGNRRSWCGGRSAPKEKGRRFVRSRRPSRVSVRGAAIGDDRKRSPAARHAVSGEAAPRQGNPLRPRSGKRNHSTSDHLLSIR